VAVWQEILGNVSRVRMNTSSNWGASWGTPRTLVETGTSLYPWVDARGSMVAVSLYHTTANGTPETVPETSQWFITYLESSDGGATFSAPATLDPLPVKTGPICTGGINCSNDRELLDFQQVAIDGSSRAMVAWTRSLDGASDTEIRFARQQ
jgi:hypothetical protein